MVLESLVAVGASSSSGNAASAGKLVLKASPVELLLARVSLGKGLAPNIIGLPVRGE